MMKKILLADDKEDVRLLVKTTLEGLDYEFHYAANGKEAYDRACQVRPDVIVLDVMMPVMDGFEACQKIKKDDSIKHIPVVILSAKGQDSDRQKGERLKADAYIVKPFSPLSLLETIESLVSQ